MFKPDFWKNGFPQCLCMLLGIYQGEHQTPLPHLQQAFLCQHFLIGKQNTIGGYLLNVSSYTNLRGSKFLSIFGLWRSSLSQIYISRNILTFLSFKMACFPSLFQAFMLFLSQKRQFAVIWVLELFVNRHLSICLITFQVDFRLGEPCIAALPTEASGNIHIFPAVRLGSELVCTAMLPNIQCTWGESVTRCQQRWKMLDVLIRVGVVGPCIVALIPDSSSVCLGGCSTFLLQM